MESALICCRQITRHRQVITLYWAMTGPTSWGTKKTQSLPLASCRQPRSLQTRSLGSLVARVLRDLATDSLLEQGDSRRTLKRLMTPCLFAILSHLLFARKTFSRPAIRQKFQGFAKVNLGLWWFLWFYGLYPTSFQSVVSKNHGLSCRCWLVCA